MFFINSFEMAPDHKNLRETVMASMAEGVQTQNLQRLLEVCNRDMAIAAQQCRETWGIQNPSSPDQVIQFLQNTHMQEVVEACCVNGKWSSKADGLRELARQGFNFAIDLLTYRKIQGYSKAVNSLLGLVHGNGRLYPKVSVLKTNRLSYSEPALMNIPKALLSTVIAPRSPEFSIVSVDIHQQEPLIVINTLNIGRLRELMESNDDFYTAVFVDIFGRECSPRERAELKMCWNATTYGASKKMLQERCHFIDGEAVYKYLHQFKELNDYIGKAYAMSKRDIQTVETYFGTEVTADKAGAQLKRSLLDIPIQGCGADILALLVEHFENEMMERELEDDIQLYYTRHDECVLEVSNRLISEIGCEGVEEILKDVFTHCVDDWTTFQVEVKFWEPDENLLADDSDIVAGAKNDVIKEALSED